MRRFLQFADPHTRSKAVIHSILYGPTKVVPGYKAEFFISLLAGTQLGSSDHGGMGEVFLSRPARVARLPFVPTRYYRPHP